MCRVEREKSEERERRRWGNMGLKTLGGEGKVDKLKSSTNMGVSRSPRMKLWMIRATTTVLLWTCLVQLTALGDLWGPRVLKGWPSCFSHDSSSALDVQLQPHVPARVLPPKSELFSFIAFLVTLSILMILLLVA